MPKELRTSGQFSSIRRQQPSNLPNSGETPAVANLMPLKRDLRVNPLLYCQFSQANSKLSFWVKKMFQLLPNDPKVPDVSKMTNLVPCLRATDKLPPEVGKEDLSRRKASRGERKAIQDPHNRPQAVSTRRARQNISASSKDILMVRQWNSGAVHNSSPFANKSHSLGSQKSSYPVSSSCAPPVGCGEEQLAHLLLFRTKTLSRTVWTYCRHQKCFLRMNRAEATLVADRAR